MCDNWLSHLTLPTSTIINFDSNKTKSCESLCSHHARQLPKYITDKDAFIYKEKVHNIGS